MPYNVREGLTLSTTQIVLLGGIAGSTIFLGLPLGRLSNPSPALKASLCALKNQEFEKGSIVVDGFAPLTIVILDR